MHYLVVLGLAPLLLGTPEPTSLCAKGRPHLVLATKDGPIAVELFEAAAPRTLKRLAALIKDSGGRTAFNYTRPHIEIYTAPLQPDVFFENEIAAEPLGIDADRVGDAGRATDIIQREIAPALKKGGKTSPRLQEWMTRWRASQDAAFLVGVSRKEINEALGYVYTKGLDSRPAIKGVLTLQPDSPTRARARLGIALSDLPTRLGRQMVIGRVVDGLALADAISTRPLAVAPGMKSLDYAPRDPVAIESIRLDCRE